MCSRQNVALFKLTILTLSCTELLTVGYCLELSTSELWWLSVGKREDYQNCSVLYCVLKLCTIISTLRWAVVTVLWIGFCLTGLISLCLDSFVFMFVFLCLSCHTACVLYYSNMVDWTWWDWILILRTFLQCFGTVGLVIWPVKTRPR